MVRSDRLLEVDWRLAGLETQPGQLTATDRDWVREVMRSWPVWLAEDGDGPVEFLWQSVGVRARRLLVRSWHPSS